jgi:hypothetical protein
MPMSEIFDTGLSKIKQEIKSRLVHHGLFGSVTNVEMAASESTSAGIKIQIIVKGRTADRTFTNEQIESCCLRVAGPVLAGILSMVDELSA